MKALHEEGSCPPQLQELMATEQSRDRFTLEDVSVAATSLGFGLENVLHVGYDEDIPDDFVENAWKECVKRSWRDHDRGAETHRIANESFRTLAEYSGSVRLRAIWENEKNRSMNPDKAYDTLEVPKEVEENMLITIYNMRVRFSSPSIRPLSYHAGSWKKRQISWIRCERQCSVLQKFGTVKDSVNSSPRGWIVRMIQYVARFY